MLRPIGPFVEYAINYDYIAKVLCLNRDQPELQCNGKCQLMQKLKQQQEDDFKSLRIVMEEYPIGFVNVFSLKKEGFPLQANAHLFTYQTHYSFLFTSSVFHPPTA